MTDWKAYLQQAVERQASDIFFVAGGPVCEKRDGRIHHVGDQRLMPEDTRQVVEQIYTAAGRDVAQFQATGDDDFSFAIPGLARSFVIIYTPEFGTLIFTQRPSFNTEFSLYFDSEKA